MKLIGVILMSILATSFPAHGGETSANETLKLDGPRAYAVAIAFGAYGEKMPDAKIENYAVSATLEGDDFRIVFSPKRAEGEAPTLGGRTSLGQELNVWVSSSTFTVTRSAFSR